MRSHATRRCSSIGVGSLIHLEGVNRPITIQLKPKSNSQAALRSLSVALPHLQERLVHSLKSTQRNLDRVNFLASCRVVDHRSTAKGGGNTTHKKISLKL